MSNIEKIEKLQIMPSDFVKAGIIPENTPDAQIKIFQSICFKYNLDPSRKQIYLTKQKKWNKESNSYETQFLNIVSIDGLRTIASRSGHVATSDALFNDSLTQYQVLQNKEKNPTTATITVTKLVNGVEYKTTATASWESYYKDTPIWKTHPFTMLSKCAEALALRKAFPEAQGFYLEDEISEIIQKKLSELE